MRYAYADKQAFPKATSIFPDPPNHAYISVRDMQRVEQLRTGECRGMVEIEDFQARPPVPIQLVPRPL